jgi:hypothetical protein
VPTNEDEEEVFNQNAIEKALPLPGNPPVAVAAADPPLRVQSQH